MDPYKQNRNIKFNAFQGLFVSAAILAFYFVIRILGEVMPISASVNPVTGQVSLGIGYQILKILLWIYAAAPLALCAMLSLKAFNNQRWVLPIVGPIAEKQANK